MRRLLPTFWDIHKDSWSKNVKTIFFFGRLYIDMKYWSKKEDCWLVKTLRYSWLGKNPIIKNLEWTVIRDRFVMASSPAGRIEVKHGQHEGWKLGENYHPSIERPPVVLSTLALFWLWVCLSKLQQLKPQRDVHGKFILRFVHRILRSMKRNCKIVQLLWGAFLPNK